MRSATYDADIEKMYGTADADLTFTETAEKIKLTNSGYGYSYYPTGLDSLAREVKALFSNSEQGVWYDPSDRATLFQDSAGTTPVTAVEQPVGLILDKSGRGNHAFQSTSASRPVLSARMNLLTKSEDFSDSV